MKPIMVFIIFCISLIGCEKKEVSAQESSSPSAIESNNIFVDDVADNSLGEQQLREEPYIYAEYAENPNKTYEFSLGKYRILDYSANIFSQPSLDGRVIGQLRLHDEIDIIENTKIEQTIENKTHYWYKINYENTEGYVWGGLIAVGAFTFNIDENEIKAYYRYSYTEGRIITSENIYYFIYSMILPDDIFIYINQRRVDNTAIRKVYLEEYISYGHSQKHYVRKDWRYCNFYEKNGNIDFFITDRAAGESHFIIKNSEIIYVESMNYAAN